MSNDQQQQIPADLEERLKAMPEDEAEDLRAVWALLGDLESDVGADPDDTWSRVRDHIESSSSTGTSPAGDRGAVEHTRHVLAGRTVRMVLGLLLAVLVGGGLFWQRPVHERTAPGEQQTVSLPDGSTVHLNSGSTLQYRRGFAVLPFWNTDRRRVRLNGEAFFDVSEADRRFVVRTGNAHVEVLGTQFNVRSRRMGEHEKTEVALVSGRVQLANRANRTKAVTLKEGEAARVFGSASPTAPRDTSIERMLVWRNGGFSVVDQPVRQVVAELERRFDVTIRVDADLPSYSVTLYYHSKKDVETILGDMCEGFNMKYRTTSGGYLLSRVDEQ